jgi:hypothetical protein
MKVDLLNRPQFTSDYMAKWLYFLQNPVSWIIEGVEIPDCNVYSGEKFLGYYRSGKLTIRAGYAFDGMTNYPDTPQNIVDALLHDFLYQTKLVKRWDADRLFLASMKANKTPNRHLIYATVRLLGGIFYGEEETIRIEKV